MAISVRKTKVKPQLSDFWNRWMGNKLDTEQKMKWQPTTKLHSPSYEIVREAERLKRQKDKEELEEKEKAERKRAQMQNANRELINVRPRKSTRIRNETDQEKCDQTEEKGNGKIIEEGAKVSNDQTKSISSDLIKVHFNWEERAQKVCIEVRLFFE